MYAYFACTIRNRLEVLDSPRFRSPTSGIGQDDSWSKFEASGFAVARPTKLIDGSRGGQAFMADILRPQGTKHYFIAEQARLQLLSVLLVGAGLTHESARKRYIDEVLPLDFDMADGLGSVFQRLLIALVLASCLSVLFTIGTWWFLTKANPLDSGLPYVVKLVSLFDWATGAMGLLMLGGNPRVRIVKKKIPAHISERLQTMADEDRGTGGNHESVRADEPNDGEKDVSVSANSQKAGEKVTVNSSAKEAEDSIRVTEESLQGGTSCAEVASGATEKMQIASGTAAEAAAQNHKANHMVTVRFGSVHGSVYTADGGSCLLPLSLVRDICSIDVKTARSMGWYIGVGWFGLLLVGSLSLQIGSALAPAFGADMLSLGILLATSLARGAGIAGRESWMIPRWKRRPGTVHGARLVGQFKSRAGLEV